MWNVYVECTVYVECLCGMWNVLYVECSVQFTDNYAYVRAQHSQRNTGAI